MDDLCQQKSPAESGRAFVGYVWKSGYRFFGCSLICLVSLAAPPGPAAAGSGDAAEEEGAGFGDGCDVDGAVHLLGAINSKSTTNVLDSIKI